MQAITALNLTRQDMFSIMQPQGMGGATRGGGTTTSNAGGFGPGAGGFAGGPPPGGAMPLGDDPNFQDVRRGAQSSDSTTTIDRPAAMDPNRIPTPLIQAVIEYLKTKGSS